jgi:lipoteichoic acid synthase
VEHRQFSTHLHLCDPNNATFRRGCIRTLLYEFVLNKTIQLTDDQRQQIAKEIELSKNRVSKREYGISDTNIIFILVESYMSFTSDLKVGGREITPFLNSLKRDSAVYFNGQMNENVTIGESSDGQFIYMSGLLPLRSIITVSKAQNIKLIGLPKILNRESRMVIPTVTSLWNQDEMCRQYEFNHLYASNDYETGDEQTLNDEQIFQLAAQKDESSQQPFFSVILTMSMHQPYTKQMDSSFLINDSSIPNDLACYLNVCHYTDHQIEKYFEHLKRIGLYYNSLIVITADHPVHNTDLGGVSKNIPLYIVNIPNVVRSKMWKGDCNQIDVYTTLLDLLGIESDWYGLGCSLLSPNYDNSIDVRKWDVSEWIIRGDYFSKEENSTICEK